MAKQKTDSVSLLVLVPVETKIVQVLARDRDERYYVCEVVTAGAATKPKRRK